MSGPSFSFGNQFSGRPAAQPAEARPAAGAAPAGRPASSGVTASFGAAPMPPAGGAMPAPAAKGDDLIKETTTRDFMRDVIEASRQVPVLVDFWAEWCGPCKQLTPVIEKVVRNAKGKVRLVKMNIDHHPEVAGQLGIRSIPAVIAFKNGQPLDGFMGAVPESQIQSFIERVAGPVGPSDAETLLAEAEAALAAGDLQGAADLFAAVREMEPDNLAGLAGLVRTLVAAKEFDEARALIATVPAAKQSDPAVAAARAQLELAEQSAKLGDSLELEARLASDANDHDARFNLALILNAHDKREAAVDHLVEIVRRKRDWNEEAARKQLLQFFDAWGPKDEMTLYGRRRLSSVLFA
ncbi:thioredoxin [Prosthecodimorpha hirschii]|uniref:thioredoxin n=1 Tax=Prosthecodimorpha hirschii TaxID=665126 RepID=UPI0015E28303